MLDSVQGVSRCGLLTCSVAVALIDVLRVPPFETVCVAYPNVRRASRAEWEGGTHIRGHGPRETLVTSIHMFVSHAGWRLRHDRPVTPIPAVDTAVEGDLT